MKSRAGRMLILIFLAGTLLVMLVCDHGPIPINGNATGTPTATAMPTISQTATKTPVISGGSNQQPPQTSIGCKGVNGQLEVKILVGPAAAVGLEPVTVGFIPFTVSSQEPYTLQGKTHLSYNETKGFSWGSYTVTMEMDADLSGECVATGSSNALNMDVKLSGEQDLILVIHLNKSEYPWKGSPTLHLNFPIQDGTSVQGEGWVFILHLNKA